jgi:hypothetical protein
VANVLPSVALVDADTVKASIDWYLNEVDLSDESCAVGEILERLQKTVNKAESRAPLSFASILKGRLKQA